MLNLEKCQSCLHRKVCSPNITMQKNELNTWNSRIQLELTKCAYYIKDQGETEEEPDLAS